jgi:hypothetical protein
MAQIINNLLNLQGRSRPPRRIRDAQSPADHRQDWFFSIYTAIGK